MGFVGELANSEAGGRPGKRVSWKEENRKAMSVEGEREEREGEKARLTMSSSSKTAALIEAVPSERVKTSR